MKIIILNMVLVMFFGCSNNYGYVYDADNRKPINDVTVKDILNPKKQVLTGTLGKFSFIECKMILLYQKKDIKPARFKNMVANLTVNAFNRRFFI